MPLFLLLSLLALAGMATANVLLPSLVKLHFPDRIGLMTSIYTTALAIGLTSASVLTVPIADAPARWRWGLASGRSPPLVAALPWLLLLRHDRSPRRPARARSRSARWRRTRLGWGMALFFGLQSLQAYSVFGWFAEVYRDAGFSAATAGLLLGVITGDEHPALVLAARRWRPGCDDQTWLIVALVACYPIGYLGLIVAPSPAPGCGRCSSASRPRVFPVVLTLIGLRARTPRGHRRTVGLHPVGGLPDRGDRSVRHGGALRPHRRLDRAVAALIALFVPQVCAGLAARATGVHRGRARPARTDA